MAGRWQPYLILALLGLLFFGELVLHPDQVLYSDHSDLLAMHLPMKQFLVRSWQQTGEIPLWCPYSFGGMPFVHDVQVAAFYPLHLPLYALPEEWIGPGLSWLVVLHVIVAGWCMFAYSSSQGLDRFAALLAAVGYMFAGKWLLHVLAGGHYIMIPLAWLPLVLLWFEEAIRRRSLPFATWAGAAFALIVLGTHPQMTLYAGLFIALWSLSQIPNHKSQITNHNRPRLGFGIWDLGFGIWDLRFRLSSWLALGAWTAVVAAALSAVQLLPALEAAPESTRAAGVAPSEIVAAAFPSLFGLVGPGWTETWEDRAGLGLLWIAAAAMAPLLYRGRVRFQARVCLALLFFSLGGAALVQWLPGFRLFQIPVRMLMLLAFPVALLAGKTTQALIAEHDWSPGVRERCQRVLIRVLFVGLFLAAASGIVHFLRWQAIQEAWPPGPVPGRLGAPLSWITQLPFSVPIYWLTLLVAAPAAVWLLGPHCAMAGRARSWAWATVLVAELLAISWPQVRVRSPAELYQPSACVQELVDRKRQTPGEPWRILERGLAGEPSSAPLGAALPMFGQVEIEPVLGYNSFDIRRYKEYLQFIVDKDESVRPREGIFGYPILDTFPICNKSLLDLLGVRFLGQPRDDYGNLPGSGEPAQCDRWKAIVEDAHPAAYSFLGGGRKQLPAYTIFENRDCYPRAFVVLRAARLADRPKVLEQLKSTDFHREVLLEGFVPEAQSPPAISGGPARTAQIREYLPNRVLVEVKADAPGFLILTDIWFPGWICTIDGEPVAIERADFLFRAVAVPAGAHEVSFTFVPASYAWGKRVSILALAALGLLSLINLIKKRLGPASQAGRVRLGSPDLLVVTRR